MSLEQDARDFGEKAGSWTLCLLVARNVVSAPGRIPADILAPKVNATTFARMSGASNDRVLRYLKIWESAAASGIVPSSAQLSPGDDVDLDGMPPWAAAINSTTLAHNVYIHLDADGVVLYVGVSLDALRRTGAHNRSVWWAQVSMIRIEHLPTREASLAREAQLISELDPPYNVVHPRRSANP